MKYIVIEIQKFADGTIAVPPISTHDTLFDALSRYHTIMAAAAVSEVPVHSAAVLTETGQEVRLDSYNHASEEPDA